MGRRKDETLLRPLLTPEEQRAARRAYVSYEKARNAWQAQPVQEAKHHDEAGAMQTWLRELVQGRGMPGPRAGRVWHRTRLPAHDETTAQTRGIYPFMASKGLPAAGAYIGRDRLTRSAFVYDPFELYRHRYLSNPNILVAGVIGTGKSSLLKTMIMRLAAFGYKFFVPADTKGEMAPMAMQMGATLVRLGPGFEAFNPLYAPPRPMAMEESVYLNRIESHRLLLLKSLGETASGRPLTAKEEVALELAVSDLTGQLRGTSVDRLAQPNFPALVECMLNPSEDVQRMIAHVGLDYERWRSETEDLGLRFRSMVRGSLRGVFDGEAVNIDLSTPGVVIDISRIRASDAAVALTMTCGQALGDLILSFSRDQWLKVLDEVWRQVRYPAILRRISEGQKLARGDDQTTGSATIMALHRITDLMGSSPEVRELAMGLLADTSTRIIYNQASDQLATTQEALSLTDLETKMLTQFGQGEGLWKVGRHSAIVNHVILRDGMEWPVVQTDSRMMREEEEQYRSVANPEVAMAQEIGMAGTEVA